MYLYVQYGKTLESKLLLVDVSQFKNLTGKFPDFQNICDFLCDEYEFDPEVDNFDFFENHSVQKCSM